MGNFTSCFTSNPQFATLIDVNGNLRRIKPPTTAAEVMIQHPGHLVSPVGDDLRSNFRLSALRADELLMNGRFYLLISAGRLNSFVTESELEMLRLDCGGVIPVKRRRRSRVLPEESGGGAVVGDGGGEGSGDGDGDGDGEGFSGRLVCSSPMWKPVLEPILE